MYLVFLLIWILFNGQLTVEIGAFGAVLAAVMYWFLCRFLDFSPQREWKTWKKAPRLLGYCVILAVEIVKANFVVIGMIFSARYEMEPVLVRFRAPLKSGFARVLLANSITLTPGTITVSMTDGEYVVHCLDKSLAVGLDRSVFVKHLKLLEEGMTE